MVIKDQQSGQYDICLINQMLPLQYRVEYLSHYSQIYEEDEYEMNEKLLVKKVIFLLIALATEDGVEDYKAMKILLAQYKAKKVTMPRKP